MSYLIRIIKEFLEKYEDYPISVNQLMTELKLVNYPYVYKCLKDLDKEGLIILAKRGKTLLIVK